ncbi:unnamed protein product [Spirodela intermedia]|uniref:Uncharacterized protein n=1 Tax=Spirodela intermedia TaxID=51605 RepID=A0A7I8L4E6_SPIIN|nr:unnamed protein product [Spirodela intermedia]
MELHPLAFGSKLWNYVKIAFFMIRKGVITKRKLFMDLNRMMKRGKTLRKSLCKSLIFRHHSSKAAPLSGFSFQVDKYEFSCGSNPLPVFSHINSSPKNISVFLFFTICENTIFR